MPITSVNSRAVHSVTPCPVETGRPHQEHPLPSTAEPGINPGIGIDRLVVTLRMLLVEPGGIEPPSETPFTSLHTAIAYNILFINLGVNTIQV